VNREEKELAQHLIDKARLWERPMPVAHIKEVIESSDIELDEDSLDKLEKRQIKAILVAKENEDLDEFYGVVSTKNQRYDEFDDIISEITGNIKTEELEKEDIDLLVLLILLIRYEAVKKEFNLGEIATGLLFDEFYEGTNTAVAKHLESVLEKFIKNHYLGDYSNYSALIKEYSKKVKDNPVALKKIRHILFSYDWRDSKIYNFEFEKLIFRLRREFNLSKKFGNWDTKSIGEFIGYFIEDNDPQKSLFFIQSFDNSIPSLLMRRKYDYEFQILEPNKKDLLFSGLQTLLKGQTSVKMCNNIQSISEKEVDLLAMMPPVSSMTKLDWKSAFKVDDIEIDSIEELHIRKSIKLLGNNGRGVFIIPNKFLSGKASSVKSLIKELVFKNSIEAVVKLPISMDLQKTYSDYSILVVNKSGVESSLFIDCNCYVEHLIYNNQRNNIKYLEDGDLVEIAAKMVIEKDEKVHFGRFVSEQEIIKNNYNIAVQNYVNPGVYAECHSRSDGEEIIKLSKVASRFIPEKHTVGREYRFLNMADLPSKEGEFLLNDEDLDFKSSYESDLPLLKKDALLLSKVGGNLKPTLFKSRNKPIFLGSSILALSVNEEIVDPEYLICELNSDFISRQIKRIPRGKTIPHMRIKDIMDIYIRVPNLKKQKNYFVEWINGIAKDKILEIENLHESLRYIEKDVFSSFAHDFGKLLFKVASNIDGLESYLKRLDEHKIISLSDSVFGDNIPEDGERVKDVINRLRESHKLSVDFLKSEVKSLTHDVQSNKKIEIGKLIEKWCSAQKEDSFTIELSEGSNKKSQYELTGKKAFENGFLITGNETDIYKILDNLLDNAIRHGFGKSKKENRFRIHLENTGTAIEKMVYVTMSIGNTGKPFPKDFSCEDFFQRRHRGPKSRGEGLGGYSIKRAVDNLGAYISCETRALSKKEYPVQFRIEFEDFNYDE